MMSELNIVSERVAEFTLPEGCPVCSGAVQVRLSPDGARMVCLSCHAITVSMVRKTPEGFELLLLPCADA
jgi:hypothetical protein